HHDAATSLTFTHSLHDALPIYKFNTIKHRWPMLSLGNTYNEQELREFDERVRKAVGDSVQYVCELKFDGLSISITYEQGKLVRADRKSTRLNSSHVKSSYAVVC